jgi:membrane-associated protein
MPLLHEAFSITQIFNPIEFLKSVGPYALIFVVLFVFIETGLLFPFLPGDSLVFAAALLSTTIRVPLYLLVIVVAVAAIGGGHSGYAIGTRIGSRLFKPDARIFKTRYRDESDSFLARYGAGAIVLARFVPVVRTFIAPIVGMSRMSVRKFAVWNAVSAFAWAVVLTLAGYWLGKIAFVANNVDLIAVLIVVISVAPLVITALIKRRRDRRAADDLAAKELV